MTAPPHIRIFPHSQEEFPAEEALTMWLLTGLKARGGKYLLRSSKAIADLPVGSIVLFRYGRVIVGEAVVLRYALEPTKDRTLTGKEYEYQAYVKFSPSSIRVYAPPIRVDTLQSFIGDSPNIVPSAQPYFKIEDWTVYPRLIGKIAVSGAFL
jgi:hypothetical protein